MPDLIERIDECLPQVQCQRCGFAGCRPYAEAIAAGTTDLNLCPPGGDTTLRALARLLGAKVQPLDPRLPASPGRVLAKIVEAECIGCTLCVRACPVDAIVGARKQMHTVLSEICTGCGLCVPPCPTDCIRLLPHPAPAAGPWPDYSADEARRARQRAQARQRRLARAAPAATRKAAPAKEDIRAEIQAAIARARAKRNPLG